MPLPADELEQGVMKASLLHMPEGNHPFHAKPANNGMKGLATIFANGALGQSSNPRQKSIAAVHIAKV